jgi:hypothetical protein
MDTYQLRNVLTRDLGPLFSGVYPRDLLPETLDQTAIVINTEPHDKPGAHWVCLYVTSPVVEYFNSYGLTPSFVVTFKTLFVATGKPFLTHTCIKL